jgi:hypothetical protein
MERERKDTRECDCPSCATGSWSELPRPHLLPHQHQQPPRQATSRRHRILTQPHCFPFPPIYQPPYTPLRPLQALDPPSCCIPTTSGAPSNPRHSSPATPLLDQPATAIATAPSPDFSTYCFQRQAVPYRQIFPAISHSPRLPPVIKHSALEACSSNRPCSRPSTSLFHCRSGSLTMTP